MRIPPLLPATLILTCGTLQALHANEIAYRLQASDFAQSPSQLAPHPERPNTPIIRQTSRQILLDLPTPETDRPLSIYVKVRAESPRDALALETYRGGERHRLADLGELPEGSWSWVRFRPQKGSAIGERLRLDAIPSPDHGRGVSLESIVVADRGDLSDEELEAVPFWLPSHPVISVHRAEKPPSLDGTGDDPAWQQATPIRDFYLFSSGAPAQLKTTVRFLYDAQHLYVQYLVDEPLLRAADMRIEELSVKATERDQVTPYESLNDDACMLMLQPRQSGPVYEWNVNSIGALLDAKMQPEQLWKTREIPWNAEGARSVVKRWEALWVWELAIPWRDLGVEPPAAGEVWNVGLARISPSRREHSTWNRTGRGAHLPEEWGALHFSDSPAPALGALAALDSINPGVNEKLFERLSSEGISALRAATHVQPERGVSRLREASIQPEQAKPFHRFEVTETGTNTTRWSLNDAATQRPFYISPRGVIAVRSSRQQLTLSTPGSYEIIVNDSQVAAGASANDQVIEFAVRHGANHLAIRTSQGVTRLELDGIQGGWRTAAASDPQATTITFDDRKWPVKQPAETAPGEPLVFRKLLLSEHTQVWPVPQPSLAIARNSIQPATFKFSGLPYRNLEQWTMWVAIPESLEVKGVSGFYGNFRPQQPVFSIQREGSKAVGGRELPLYRVTADKPLFYDEKHLPGGRTGLFHLMLRVADKVPEDIALTEQIHYWAEAEEGAAVELPQSFIVNSAVSVQGKQPKRYVFELWGSNFGTLDSEEVRTSILSTMRAAGFNLLVENRDWTLEHAPKFGVAVRPLVNFSSWSINLMPHLKQHPEDRLIDKNGKPSEQWICTSQLLGERWPAVDKAFAELMHKFGSARSICYDYEHSPVKGPHSCFCERCLAAFRKEKKITGELDAKMVESRYRSEWDDFMARRAAKILANMRRTVHETIPEGIFTVFSLPLSPRTVSVYGIDWRYVLEEGGADVIQVGTSGGWRHITGVSEIAGDIPVMYGVWILPYGPNHMIPAHVAQKSELLRRCLDSTYGLLFYDRATMNGISWHNVGETTRLVADFEEMFISGKRKDVSGVNAEYAQWLSGDGKQLLCVMNHGSTPAEWTIPLPSTARNGYEYYTGEKTGDRASLHIALPPGQTAVYVFNEPES